MSGKQTRRGRKSLFPLRSGGGQEQARRRCGMLREGSARQQRRGSAQSKGARDTRRSKCARAKARQGQGRGADARKPSGSGKTLASAVFLPLPAGRPRFPAAFVSDGVFFRPGGGLFPRRSALLCDGAPLLRGGRSLPCCGALFGGGSLLFRSRLFRGGRFGFRGVGK